MSKNTVVNIPEPIEAAPIQNSVVPREGVKSGRMLGNAKRSSGNGLTPAEVKANMDRWMAEDSEEIVGTFINLEHRGQSIAFGMHLYDGDVEFYELFDGEEYALPRGVVRHLNKGCYTTKYVDLYDEFGNQQQNVQNAKHDGRLKAKNMQVHKKVHRFNFKIRQYGNIDLDLEPSGIVEVTQKNPLLG